MNTQLEICGIVKQENKKNNRKCHKKICDKLEMEAENVIKVYRKQSKSIDGQKRNAGTLVITLKRINRMHGWKQQKRSLLRNEISEERMDNAIHDHGTCSKRVVPYPDVTLRPLLHVRRSIVSAARVMPYAT
ncbi:unnamed protein product [Arctia plantaginis]|uniref:FP protein N-terminal domain-containing protein n=1 Tax=Arctia plantaginis TaxID=874455 RepID=A0A8S0Z4D3_ARCPL|nr:unnamed protein product [Arctia plantaginis]